MIKKLHCDIYGADVWLVVGSEDLAIFYKRRKVSGETLTPDRLQGFVQNVDVVKNEDVTFRDYLIYLEDKDNFYTLLHETVHLVNHILRDRNAHYDWYKDEVFAYYQTYWVKKLWRAVDTKGKND